MSRVLLLQLQAEKAKQRSQQKKETLDAVKQWKKRKNGKGLNDNDDQQLEDIMRGEGDVNASGGKRKRAAGGDDRDGKKPRVGNNKNREARDKKYGFGGKKRGLKHNTKESTNDMSSFPGARKGRNNAGAKGKANAPKPKRAGKMQRANQRSKGRR